MLREIYPKESSGITQKIQLRARFIPEKDPFLPKSRGIYPKFIPSGIFGIMWDISKITQCYKLLVGLCAVIMQALNP